MRIAAITIFCNESFRLDDWLTYYNNYKEVIAQHIIIDNNSHETESALLKAKFPESTIIKLKENGGVTAAYNCGIKEALNNPEIEAIMLICNDIKIEKKSVELLFYALNDTEKIGLVAPVLLEKDSDVIADGGCIVDNHLYMNPHYVGQHYTTIQDYEVTAVTGGMNMGSRAFYESVEPQDEMLFMYSDEIDVGFQAKLHGYKMMLVGNVCAWHQHVFPFDLTRRVPVCDYLMARNKVYLGNKYFGKRKAFSVFMYIIIRSSLRIVKNLICKKNIEPCIYSIKGAIDGLKNKMGKPYMIDN